MHQRTIVATEKRERDIKIENMQVIDNWQFNLWTYAMHEAIEKYFIPYSVSTYNHTQLVARKKNLYFTRHFWAHELADETRRCETEKTNYVNCISAERKQNNLLCHTLLVERTNDTTAKKSNRKLLYWQSMSLLLSPSSSSTSLRFVVYLEQVFVFFFLFIFLVVAVARLINHRSIVR